MNFAWGWKICPCRFHGGLKLVKQMCHVDNRKLHGLKVTSVWARPAYSPEMSPIEHVWDALDRRIRQRVPVPANIQQLCTAIEEECTNIPQATINNLINSMRRRCVALHEANGGHTRYWLVFRPPNTVQLQILEWPFIKAHLCNNHAV